MWADGVDVAPFNKAKGEVGECGEVEAVHRGLGEPSRCLDNKGKVSEGRSYLNRWG